MRKIILIIVLLVFQAGCCQSPDTSTLTSVGYVNSVSYVPGNLGASEKTIIQTEDGVFVVVGHISVSIKQELFTAYYRCVGKDKSQFKCLVQNGVKLGTVEEPE